MFMGLFLLSLLFVSVLYGQPPANGENEYRLAAVNPRSTGGDTLTGEAGRGVWVTTPQNDLDNDGKPEIIVTEYWYHGRVFVYEMIGNDQLELVWVSKKITEEKTQTSEETPRSVTVGDFDNNGKQEIIFPIGYSYTDSLEHAIRGIYFYEWTGNDNDYGTEPVFKLTYEFIDSALATQNLGQIENGIRVQDIDGDGKSEFLFPPRQVLIPDAKLTILEVESGTFENSDAVIDHEYIYTGMVQPPVIAPDSYVPCGTEIGDVDGDGFDEIIILGWTSALSGAGLGFIQINGPDSYTDGSVVDITSTTIFAVKSKPLFTLVNGNPVIYIHGTRNDASQSWMYVVEGIVSDQFVTPGNIHELFHDTGYWSAWALGDQDHPTNGPGDGIDLYLYGGSGRLLDIEYDGTGDVTDTSSYNITEIYDLANVYNSLGGLFNDVFTYPGMDLDNDGYRDIVASYKGWSLDSLAGIPVGENGFHVFFFEWGDSSQSIDLEAILDIPKPLSIIMPDDYQLAQNYPNPFNPTTTIDFTLPISKTISLKIYNALGQEVRTLINNQKYTPGSHTIQWDSKDNNGNKVASGLYIYKLIYGNFSKSKKMTLIR